MRSMRSWMSVMALVGLAWTASVGIVQAAPVSVTIPLTGAQQVPPVTTPATGSAKLTYDSASHVLTWSVTYSGLSTPVTMAHFHGPAPEGKNAGVLIWISKKGEAVASPIKGEVTLTEAQATQMLAGDWYVNVHTSDHPGGEIRGQVVPPKT